ncbi:MAG: DUF6573 family protein [Thermodesulfovibrionales bacterium]
MGTKRQKCPNCGEKLEQIYHKLLEWNVPDSQRGRGLCPECGKGCITFDINIYHNDLERGRYPQTDEEKYGLCCSCGKRGDSRLWWERPSPEAEKPPFRIPAPGDDQVEDILASATPHELAMASLILGRPFKKETNDKDSLFSEDDMIFSYTRKQAIEDGVLVDVTYLATQEGYIYPVAMTRTLFEKYIRPDSTAEKGGETVMGRLHDVLTVLRVTAKRVEHADPAIVFFMVKFSMHGRPRTVKLKSICGPGDTLEPVVTIMFPDED